VHGLQSIVSLACPTFSRELPGQDVRCDPGSLRWQPQAAFLPCTAIANFPTRGADVYGANLASHYRHAADEVIE
jgi:hypothetical protein